MRKQLFLMITGTLLSSGACVTVEQSDMDPIDVGSAPVASNPADGGIDWEQRCLEAEARCERAEEKRDELADRCGVLRTQLQQATERERCSQDASAQRDEDGARRERELFTLGRRVDALASMCAFFQARLARVSDGGVLPGDVRPVIHGQVIAVASVQAMRVSRGVTDLVGPLLALPTWRKWLVVHAGASDFDNDVSAAARAALEGAIAGELVFADVGLNKVNVRDGESVIDALVADDRYHHLNLLIVTPNGARTHELYDRVYQGRRTIDTLLPQSIVAAELPVGRGSFQLVHSEGVESSLGVE